MKYRIEFDLPMYPWEMAKACNDSASCPLDNLDTPCPIGKPCSEVTEDDWDALAVAGSRGLHDEILGRRNQCA